MKLKKLVCLLLLVMNVQLVNAQCGTENVTVTNWCENGYAKWTLDNHTAGDEYVWYEYEDVSLLTAADYDANGLLIGRTAITTTTEPVFYSDFRVKSADISPATALNYIYIKRIGGGNGCPALEAGDSEEDVSGTCCAIPVDAFLMTLGASSTVVESTSPASLTAGPSGAAYYYQWYRDGIEISGENSDSYTTDIAGEYKVRAYASSPSLANEDDLSCYIEDEVILQDRFIFSQIDVAPTPNGNGDICIGQQYELSATTSGGTITWSAASGTLNPTTGSTTNFTTGVAGGVSVIATSEKMVNGSLVSQTSEILITGITDCSDFDVSATACNGDDRVITALANASLTFSHWESPLGTQIGNSSSLTVQPLTTTDYFAVGVVPTANVLTNGSFEAGDNGFLSGGTYYNLDPNGGDGNNEYTIATSTAIHNPWWLDIGNIDGGRMFVADAKASKNVLGWEFTATPGETYFFSGWMGNFHTHMTDPAQDAYKFPADLHVYISAENAAPSSTDIEIADFGLHTDNDWHTTSGTWTVPPGAGGTYTLYVKNESTHTAGGNDFALDDFKLQQVDESQTRIKKLTIESCVCDPAVPAVGGTYCGDEAIFKVKSNYFPVLAGFNWYASDVSATALTGNTFTDNDSVFFQVPISSLSAAVGVDKELTIYLEDNTIQTGAVFQQSESCDPTYSQSEFLNAGNINNVNYQMGFVAYENITLTSVDIPMSIQVFCCPNAVSGSVTFAVYEGKNGNGGIVADVTKQIGSDFTLTFSETTDNDLIITSNMNIVIPGVKSGFHFFIAPKSSTKTGNGNIRLRRAGCNNQATGIVDDLSGSVIEYYGNSQTGQNFNTNGGHFFNLNFDKSSNPGCPRIPVKVKEDCPPCSQPTAITFNPTSVHDVCLGAALPPFNVTATTPGAALNTAFTISISKDGGSFSAPTGIGATDDPTATLPLTGNATAAQDGVYTVRIEDGNTGDAGCYFEADFELNVISSAVPSTTALTDFCESTTPVPTWNATAATGYDLLWHTDASTGTGSATRPAIPTSTTGTKQIWVSQKFSTAPGCESNRVALDVDVIGDPATPSLTAPLDFCAGTTAPTWTGVASAGTNELRWYTAATGGSGVATAPTITNTAGTKEVWVSERTTAAPNCESARQALSVEALAAPAAPTAAAQSDFCENGTASTWTASATTGNSLLWHIDVSTGTGSATVPTITNTPSGTREVWVSQKQTAAPGCESGRTQLSLTVNPTPAPTAMAATVCSGTEFTVTPVDVTNGTVPTGTTYTWGMPTGTGFSGGAAQATGATSVTGNLTNTNTDGTAATAVYTVTPRTGSCDGAPFTVTVTVNPGLTITQPSNTGGCAGSAASLSVTATGVGPFTYAWTKLPSSAVGTNSNALSFTSLSAADEGSYQVQVTAASCGTVISNTATVTVTLTEAPRVEINLSKDKVCTGETITLTANVLEGGGSAPEFTFRNATTNVVIGTANQLTNTVTTAALTNTGTAVTTIDYTVELNSNSTCVGTNLNPVTSDSKTVQIDPQAETANIIETDQTICTDGIPLTTDPISSDQTGTWSKTSSGSETISTTGLAANIATATTGIFRYEVASPLGICLPKSDQVAITRAGDLTNPDPVSTQSASICSSAPAPSLTGIAPLNPGEAATWTATAPATINSSGQTANLQTGANTFTYTISNPTSGCPPASADIVITVVGAPDVSLVNPATNSSTAPLQTGSNSVSLEVGSTTTGTGYSIAWTPVSGQGSPVAPTDQLTISVDGMTTVNTTTVVRATVSEVGGTCIPAFVDIYIERVDKTMPNLIDPSVCVGTDAEIPLPTLIPTIESERIVSVTPAGPTASIVGRKIIMSTTGLTAGSTYDILYEVDNSASGIVTDVATVTIIDVPTGGDFTITDQCEGVGITIIATAATNATSYSWVGTNATNNSSLGLNGSFVIGSNPSSSYTIELTPSNACGAGAVISKTAAINFKPSDGTLSASETSVCSSDALANVTFTLSGVLYNATSYTWTTGSDAPVTDATLSKTVGLNGASGTSYQVSVVPENTCGKGAPVSTSVVVEQPVLPEISLKSDKANNLFCIEDGKVVFTATDPKGQGDNPQFEFNVVGSGLPPVKGSDIDFTATMTQNPTTVQVIMYSDAACRSKDTAQAFIKMVEVVPAAVNVSQKTDVCFGESITVALQVAPSISPSATIKWYNNGDNTGNGELDKLDSPEFTVNKAGSYSYVASYKSDICPVEQFTDNIDFTIWEQPIIDFTGFLVEQPLNVRVDSKELTTNTFSVAILGSENDQMVYDWKGEGIVDQTKKDLTVTYLPNQEGYFDYLLLATNKNYPACFDEKSFQILASISLRIPNAFSPNGDGSNDRWDIPGISRYPDAVVKVFNRWGSMIDERKVNKVGPWDGADSPVGTYYYIINLQSEVITEPLTGAVTLVR